MAMKKDKRSRRDSDNGVKPLDINDDALTALIQRLSDRPATDFGDFPDDAAKELIYLTASAKTRTDKLKKVMHGQFFPAFPDLNVLHSDDPAECDRVRKQVEAMLAPLGRHSELAKRVLAAVKAFRSRGISFTDDAIRKLESEDGLWSLLETDVPGAGPKIIECLRVFSFLYDGLPLDAHNRRILCRFGVLPPDFLGKRGDASKRKMDAAYLALRKLVSNEKGRALHNQLMEFGQTICTAQRPKCEGCPLADRCLRQGLNPTETNAPFDDPSITGGDDPQSDAPDAQSDGAGTRSAPSDDQSLRPKSVRSPRRGKDIQPRTFDDMIGQESAKQRLDISLRASRNRDEPPPHMAFCGPSGCGKTTLARIVAIETGAELVSVNGAELNLTILRQHLIMLSPDALFFIDEAHAMRNNVQDLLLTAVDRFRLSIADDSGQMIDHPIGPFTLIIATTNPERLFKPLHNRIRLSLELVPYTQAEMVQLVARAARLLAIQIDDDAVESVAGRSLRTPRTAEQRLWDVLDFVDAHRNGSRPRINKAIVQKAMGIAGVDSCGLAAAHRTYLQRLASAHPGALSVADLAAALVIDTTAVTGSVEPTLMRLGFVEKSSRGRRITAKGLDHINGGHGELV